MKKIVSISLGSSKRDHQGEFKVDDEIYQIERIGTDGSLSKAKSLIERLDGKVDAFGMGGIDLYLRSGRKQYIIREARKLKKAAQKTPIVDGSGLKTTLEPRAIKYLQKEKIIDFSNKRVLFTSCMDRFAMAEAIKLSGGDLIIGDLMFGLGIKLPLYSLKELNLISKVLAPLICQLPFRWLYPTGEKQDTHKRNYFEEYYKAADIIAGDYHYIKRYMPTNLSGKLIITNTLTKEDIIQLKERGVILVVTTTPELQGRSFGTNVMEALLVTILKDRKEAVMPSNYDEMIEELKLIPRIIPLQETEINEIVN